MYTHFKDKILIKIYSKIEILMTYCKLIFLFIQIQVIETIIKTSPNTVNSLIPKNLLVKNSPITIHKYEFQ